jgi:hypothetical protein
MKIISLWEFHQNKDLMVYKNLMEYNLDMLTH